MVNIYGRSVANNRLLLSYNPVKNGTTTAYAPVIMNNYYGYNTALIIRMWISHNPHHGYLSLPVPSPSERIRRQFFSAFLFAIQWHPEREWAWVNSATIVSTSAGSGAQPIIALVNEVEHHGSSGQLCWISPEADTRVNAPIVMKRYYAYNTECDLSTRLGRSRHHDHRILRVRGASLGTTTVPQHINRRHDPLLSAK